MCCVQPFVCFYYKGHAKTTFSWNLFRNILFLKENIYLSSSKSRWKSMKGSCRIVRFSNFFSISWGRGMAGNLRDMETINNNNTKDYVTNELVVGMKGVKIFVTPIYTCFCEQLWGATERKIKKGDRN